eukprot:TRINITY_DN17435_c0_g1_i1.p1 TRINITY_DN17435_c0_g1~~TRINITY_DN17435_c0_g1_i1.p1  ORF type:complete len:163 (+),score=20.93 TRINITY_DN17435_c0_g1_i1:26-514(+)
MLPDSDEDENVEDYDFNGNNFNYGISQFLMKNVVQTIYSDYMKLAREKGVSMNTLKNVENDMKNLYDIQHSRMKRTAPIINQLEEIEDVEGYYYVNNVKLVNNRRPIYNKQRKVIVAAINSEKCISKISEKDLSILETTEYNRFDKDGYATLKSIIKQSVSS